MNKFLFSLFLSLFSLSLFSQQEEATAEYYAKIKSEADLAKMTFFFSQMPKGGDLHHHFGGALYAESYLEWLTEKDYFLNTQSLKAEKTACDDCVEISTVWEEEGLFERVLERWSTQDYEHRFPDNLPPDQHFFNTFYYFGNPDFRKYKEGLQNLRERAIRENVQYIETQALMIRVPMKFPSYDEPLWSAQQKGDSNRVFEVLAEIEDQLKGKELDEVVKVYIERLKGYHEDLDNEEFTIRFQSYIVRFLNPTDIFTHLYASFMVAEQSPLIVGVNIVAPEHGRVSMKDYWLHMQIFRYLSGKFPQVKKSLHAGELALGMVKPEDLTYHIHDAIFIAEADRIGHGIDIPYEKEALKTMKYMAKEGKAVEVNLTSNEFILGISGPQHPLRLYREFGVPLVISTDDPGVSRNSLTNEYLLLGSRYEFSYTEIKSLVYNSIRYSFLSPKDKLLNLRRLDSKFEAFEKMIAEHYLSIKD
ncbi:MAG: adenosine deaminase [Bacteroidota bacterium]